MESTGKKTMKQDFVFENMQIEHSPQQEMETVQKRNEKRIMSYSIGLKRLLYGTKNSVQ